MCKPARAKSRRCPRDREIKDFLAKKICKDLEIPDGRAVLVRFTQRGHRLMQQSFELFAEIENEYCRQLGPRTYATLKRALRVLGERPPSGRRKKR
jgi:DNA-binding MarR family transcriptional regulator